MDDEVDPSDDELLADEIPGVLSVRIDRRKVIDVRLDGIPLEIASIDVDEPTLRRLAEIPRTVRS